MDFQLYLIKGEENSGKTTVCWKILNLLQSHSLIECYHLWRTSYSEGIVYDSTNKIYKKNNNPVDFVTILSVRCKSSTKKIAIISAGDDDTYLKKQIYDMLANDVQHIICCCRSVDKKGSALHMLKSEFSKHNFSDSNIKKLEKNKNTVEEDMVANSVFTIITSI